MVKAFSYNVCDKNNQLYSRTLNDEKILGPFLITETQDLFHRCTIPDQVRRKILFTVVNYRDEARQWN